MSKQNLFITQQFEEQLAKVNREHALLIISWLNKHLDHSLYPRKPGKELPGELADVWRYRVGDYRVICKIEKDSLLVLALESRHHKLPSFV